MSRRKVHLVLVRFAIAFGYFYVTAVQSPAQIELSATAAAIPVGVPGTSPPEPSQPLSREEPPSEPSPPSSREEPDDTKFEPPPEDSPLATPPPSPQSQQDAESGYETPSPPASPSPHSSGSDSHTTRKLLGFLCGALIGGSLSFCTFMLYQLLISSRYTVLPPRATPVDEALQILIIGATGLRNADTHGFVHAYCVCEIEGRPTCAVRTKTKHETFAPVWNERAEVKGFGTGDSLVFKVFDFDEDDGDEFLGIVILRNEDFYPKGFEGKLLLAKADDEDAERQAWLYVQIPAQEFSSVKKMQEAKVKLAIAEKFAGINDAQSFLEARSFLRTLGGAKALREELISLAYVDPVTEELSVGNNSSNKFVCLANGTMVEDDLVEEQTALGKFRSRYLITRNIQESYTIWSSKDFGHMQIVAMSKKHRILTTRDLHWQWFNPIVFGMPFAPSTNNDTASGHVEDIQLALTELQNIKTAALLYTSSTSGFEGGVGLYVNSYGLSERNCLCVHILDTANLGPAFDARANCPLDAVIEALQIEMARPEDYVAIKPGSSQKMQPAKGQTSSKAKHALDATQDAAVHHPGCGSEADDSSTNSDNSVHGLGGLSQLRRVLREGQAAGLRPAELESTRLAINAIQRRRAGRARLREALDTAEAAPPGHGSVILQEALAEAAALGFDSGDEVAEAMEALVEEERKDTVRAAITNTLSEYTRRASARGESSASSSTAMQERHSQGQRQLQQPKKNRN